MRRFAASRSIIPTVIVVLLALVASACSSASSPSTSSSAANYAPAAPQSQRAPSEAIANAPASSASGQAAGAPALQDASARSAAAGASQAGSVGESTLPRLDRLVIANVSISGTVENAITAAREAERITTRYGGFVGNANVRDVDSGREAAMTLRIPMPNLHDALEEIRALGTKVSSETLTTEDVTEEYTDVESNVRNLRATETRLLSLQEKSTQMNEILSFQRELTNIRGQIERLEGRRRVLENKTTYAVITVRFAEPVTIAPRQPWSIVDTASQALGALARVGQYLAIVGVWAVVLLPLYGIPMAALWLIVRRRPERSATGEPAPQ